KPEFGNGGGQTMRRPLVGMILLAGCLGVCPGCSCSKPDGLGQARAEAEAAKADAELLRAEAARAKQELAQLKGLLAGEAEPHAGGPGAAPRVRMEELTSVEELLSAATASNDELLHEVPQRAVVFKYSGGGVTFWAEIEQDGQKETVWTVPPLQPWMGDASGMGQESHPVWRRAHTHAHAKQS